MKSAMSKSRPMNLVLHNQLSARKNPVNLVTVDEERGGHSGSGKQWRTDQSQDPIEYSQVRRQENTQHADSWRQGHRDESSISTGAGELGISAGYSIFAMEAMKTTVLIWRLFISSSLKAATHLGPNYTENLDVFMNTNIEEIQNLFQHHTEIGIGTFRRDS